MSYLAQHDSLTDLPHPVLFNDRRSEAITLTGHAVGDRLLQSVTWRSFTCVLSSDTVGRPGGDELVVCRPEGAEAPRGCSAHD